MKVTKTINLPHDDLDWFLKSYGEDISLSGILTMLLHNFRQIHIDVGLTPIKAARDSAKEVKEMLDEGILNEKKKE